MHMFVMVGPFLYTLVPAVLETMPQHIYPELHVRAKTVTHLVQTEVWDERVSPSARPRCKTIELDPSLRYSISRKKGLRAYWNEECAFWSLR